MEDLDRVASSAEHEHRQLADLAALGLESQDTVVRQSERFASYDAAIAGLAAAELTYECYCTRREIREASAAPHGELAAYPGTCRALTDADRAARRATHRRPAVRLRTPASMQRVTVDDQRCGPYTGVVDDVVLRRNDGVPAYNLAVVVDDAAQGVGQVVRGDDLLASTPRQVVLQRLLGLATPAYVHVPLAVGPDGARLAKRHGAVTMRDLAALGVDPPAVLGIVAHTLGLAAAGERPSLDEVVARAVQAAGAAAAGIGAGALRWIPDRPWTVDGDVARSWM